MALKGGRRTLKADASALWQRRGVFSQDGRPRALGNASIVEAGCHFMIRLKLLRPLCPAGRLSGLMVSLDETMNLLQDGRRRRAQHGAEATAACSTMRSGFLGWTQVRAGRNRKFLLDAANSRLPALQNAWRKNTDRLR